MILMYCSEVNYGYGDHFKPESIKKLKPEDKVQLCDLIIRIWDIIRSKDIETKIELTKRLVEEAYDLTRGTCSTGWVERLMNVLTGQNNEFTCSFNPKALKSEIKQKINTMIQNSLNNVDDEVLSDLLMNGMIGSDIDSIRTYNMWLIKFKPQLLKSIYEDYKNSDNIPKLDLERFFNEVFDTFIVKTN